MRPFVLLCFGTACAISAFAAPTPSCTSETYAAYAALSTGCTDGDATFSNFGALNFTNSGGVATIPESDIMVIPGGTTLDPNLTFEYVNSSGTATPETVDVSGQILTMQFVYSVTLSASTLDSIQMNETFSNTSPGSVSATKNAEIGTGPVFTSTVTDGGITNPANTTSNGNVEPTSGTGVWSITDTISLQAQTGSATQNSFENAYVLTASTTAVPEPSMLLACGVILLMLGIPLKRRRTSTES
jgi:hypothetical protein